MPGDFDYGLGPEDEPVPHEYPEEWDDLGDEDDDFDEELDADLDDEGFYDPYPSNFEEDNYPDEDD